MFLDVLKLCICVENDFSSKIRDFSSFGFDFTDMIRLEHPGVFRRATIFPKRSNLVENCPENVAVFSKDIF